MQTIFKDRRQAGQRLAARLAPYADRRESAYRGHERPPELRGKTVLLVDDGIATGATMRAAARAVRLQGAAWLVVAVPTASSLGCAELAAEADEVVALLRPKCFFAVGQWYEEFSQITDEEVSALLLKARQKLVSVGPRAESYRFCRHPAQPTLKPGAT